MLELTQLMAELGALTNVAQTRGKRTGEQLGAAVRQATLDAAAWNDSYSESKAAAVRWDCAVVRDGVPGVVVPLPASASPVYSALATDGSQIPLDRHAVAPCFVVNVGEIVLHYGTEERPLLNARASLFYDDKDIYIGDGFVTERHIGQRRSEAEWASLTRLMTDNAGRTALALSDGPLVLVFANQREGEGEQREMVDRFCAMLEAGRVANIPTAGYVSRPGSRDVVGALRVSLCGDGCRHGSDDLCSRLSRLTDVSLFGHLLVRPGDRSGVFGSQARSLQMYPDPHKVCFFYVQTGAEIARVEVPQWVADSPALLAQVHILTHDQIQKGQGYPVCLSEAHERAVVRGADRDAFLHLVERAYVNAGLPALHTRKAMAKRTRVL